MARVPVCIIAVLAAQVSMAHGSNTKTQDRLKPASTVDELLAGDSQALAVESEARLLYRLATEDGDLKSEKARLDTEHSDWTAAREACVPQQHARSCVIEAGMAYISELRHMAVGEANDSSISESPFGYRCDGFSPLISVVKVRTEPALINLSFGIDSMVLQKVESAAADEVYGSDNDKGKSTFTIGKDYKGTFVLQGGTPMACEFTELKD